MNTLLEALDTASAPDRDSYRPVFFRLNDPSDRDGLEDLLKREPHIVVHDELHGQLTELVRTQNPTQRFSKDELDAAALSHLKGREPKHYGVWVYYPWSKLLVHLLDETEFIEVRTDRNRNKITTTEQNLLSTKKIGVIGLSVGQSVCLTMALERSCGELRIADFDTLELSNLNRIRSGVHEMGTSKVVNTAREVAELDPFLKVVIYPEGITPGSIDAFLTDGGNLDVLVEECDSVDVKIYARQKAKALGIPVVMDMSDRGCLDIERFDLEPDRPLMHGWIDHLDLNAAGRPMTAEEKVPYMLPISGVETLSARMKASVIELGQTVSSWPQLATSVVLGGALAGDAVRRIALDQLHASGRWFIDLDELISDESIPEPTRPEPTVPFTITDEDLDGIGADLPAPPVGCLDLNDEQLTELLEAGALAPSAGNMQPWKFAWYQKRLLIFHDIARSASFWDPDHLIAQIALGTCIENISQRAVALGLDAEVSLAPLTSHPALAGALAFRALVGKELSAPERLNDMIGVRCTNRKVVAREPLPTGVLDKLMHAITSIEGCHGHVIDQTEKLAEISALCGAAERIRVVNPIGHQEFFAHELRWNAEEAERTRDGLDIATLEIGPVDVAGLKVAADPRAMALVDSWQAGHGLERLARRSIQAASAVILVSISGDSVQERLAGGRAVERLWMTANAEGWAVHPISAPIFLTHASHSPMEGLRERERAELVSIEQRFEALWNIQGERPLFLVRLSRSSAPSVRSLRLPIQNLLFSPNHQPV